MNYLNLLIENHRRKMFELANKYGFSSEQVVDCSQKLDILLNQLMHEEQKNMRMNQVS